MKTPLRIGLVAEGEAELGTSVPFIYDPKQGGKSIDFKDEGALHKLIRRELLLLGCSDCVFVHRHRTSSENLGRYRTGFSVIQPKYLAQVVLAWKPEEIDCIIIVIDEDDKLEQRSKELNKAKHVLEDNYLDGNENPIQERHVLGLAIRSFDTWLLADVESVTQFLKVNLSVELSQDLEALPADKKSPMCAKLLLDDAIDRSTYCPENPPISNRNLVIRWELAEIVKLGEIKRYCAQGYGNFINSLSAMIAKIDFGTQE